MSVFFLNLKLTHFTATVSFRQYIFNILIFAFKVISHAKEFGRLTLDKPKLQALLDL